MYIRLSPQQMCQASELRKKMLYFFVHQSIAVGSYKGLFKPLMFENLYT